MNIDQAVARALEQPTLADALTWICVWENDRAVQQAKARPDEPRETCFGMCIRRVREAWVSDCLSCEAERAYKQFQEQISLQGFIGVMWSDLPKAHREAWAHVVKGLLTR
jgi:hypothetical protein